MSDLLNSRTAGAVRNNGDEGVPAPVQTVNEMGR
jgi:hypothetical protein